jgi:protoporphyrinogen/coproporphyrinogen III oxidase
MSDMHHLDDARPQVVIIGGGITGLSAAYALERAAQAAGQPISCTLIERDDRLGGKIRTDWRESQGAHLVEGGPDSFVTQKPWAADLARELGLGDTIHASEPARHATYVLQGQRLTPLPDGTLLIIPTRFWPFITSPLISPLGKLRMGLDLLIPARRDQRDESLADFIRRRLGGEALDQLAEPLMAGIHSAECERQSLLATFPRFRETEQRHGSLIRGMVAARQAAAARPGAPPSPFTTLRGGMGSLIDALRGKIQATIRTGCSVVAIAPGLEAGRHQVRLSDGTRLDADAVIVTTPAYNAADLLEPISPTLAAQLRGIRYVSTATITICVREEQITRRLDGYGVIIPRTERRKINACTISSRKFAGRAPAGSALVRAFVGGSRTPEALQLGDHALIATVMAELRSILGLVGEPQFTSLYRWERGNPQYDVGHLERVAAIERLQPQGIWLAGAAYQGVGIPDCIRQGRAAAAQALQHLQTIESTPVTSPVA